MSKGTPIFIVIIVVLIGLTGYFAFQNNKLQRETTEPSSSPQASSAQISNSSSSPAAKSQPTRKDTEKSIETNVNTQNYEGLINLMTKPTVNFTIYASECCQPQTPQEAIDQLKYVDEGTPFLFDQTTNTVKNLKAKNPNLANTYIGISKSKEHMIAFTIDKDNMISKIEVSVTWKLYEQ